MCVLPNISLISKLQQTLEAGVQHVYYRIDQIKSTEKQVCDPFSYRFYHFTCKSGTQQIFKHIKQVTAIKSDDMQIWTFIYIVVKLG